MKIIDKREPRVWRLNKKRIETEYVAYECSDDEDYIEWFGITLPMFPIVENNEVREMTPYEKVHYGLCELEHGEYFDENNELKHSYQDTSNVDMINPVWDDETHEWKETATEQELEEHKEFLAKIKYAEELELAAKALVEFQLGLISKDEFNQVGVYIQQISNTTTYSTKDTIQRPLLLERYKTWK
jgi:hypothetical protein